MKLLGVKFTAAQLGGVCIGGGFGIASGWCYRKYSRLSSMGFGMGFVATQLRNRAVKYLDLNKDGKVDLEDVKVVEEKTGAEFGIVSGICFVGGFGIGYVAGFFY